MSVIEVHLLGLLETKPSSSATILITTLPRYLLELAQHLPTLMSRMATRITRNSGRTLESISNWAVSKTQIIINRLLLFYGSSHPCMMRRLLAWMIILKT